MNDLLQRVNSLCLTSWLTNSIQKTADYVTGSVKRSVLEVRLKMLYALRFKL